MGNPQDRDDEAKKKWEGLAEKIANEALPYRVDGREWQSCLMVARTTLRMIDASQMVPLKDAFSVYLQKLEEGGFAIVRRDVARELIMAADASGLSKAYPNDSLQARRVKAAFQAFRTDDGLVRDGKPKSSSSGAGEGR